MAKTLTVFLAADLRKFNSGMDQAQRKTQGFSGTLKDKMGPAFIAAGAAAGAFALKLAKDGVQAAIEDEKAVAQLTQTLGNLNLAHDTAAVEDYISQLERAYGVADTELRPAYERLVRSTKDTEEANRALKIAMDVAAGTGKSLKTVTDSLGRAFDGQTSTLARLGTGIDKASLATMSMDEILGALSSNFSGAADAAANTFEGRMKRLQTASDNLAEAFGTGLLSSLNDATEGTQNAVDAMGDLEPLLESLGETIGERVTDFALLASVVTDATTAAQNLGEESGILPSIFSAISSTVTSLIPPVRTLGQAMHYIRGITADLSGSGSSAGESIPNLNREVKDSGEGWEDLRYSVHGAQGALARMYAPLMHLYDGVEQVTRTTRSGTRQTEEYTKKQQKLLDQIEPLGAAFQATRDDLLDQIKVVEDATQAIEDYATSIQQDLLSGIDLGTLYTEGQETGVSLIEGFNQAVAQAEYFGAVLTEIKRQGADQRLLEEIAGLGPETGAALGQELLEGGLVPELNAKWVGVQETTKELALGLVPEFLEAGRQDAIATLDGLAGQFKKDQKKFAKLGRQLGKQVGAEFKKQIVADVRDAVRAVEAAATAARAEAVANAEAEQARITQNSVARAIAGLIRDSDQRSGRNVQPVLQ